MVYISMTHATRPGGLYSFGPWGRTWAGLCTGRASSQGPGIEAEYTEKGGSWKNIADKNNICTAQFVDGYVSSAPICSPGLYSYGLYSQGLSSCGIYNMAYMVMTYYTLAVYTDRAYLALAYIVMAYTVTC